MHISHVIMLQALYGTTFTIGKKLANQASFGLIIGTRMTIAGALLLFIHFLFHKNKSIRLTKQTISYLAQLSLFSIYIPYMLRYWAVPYLAVSTSALLFNLTPLITYMLCLLMGVQKHCWNKVIGLGVGVLGCLPTIFYRGSTTNCPTYSGTLPLPEIATILAIISLSYGWIVMRKLVRLNTISPFAMNGIIMLVGGLGAFATIYLTGMQVSIYNPSQFALWLSLIMLITNGICYNLQAVLLNHFSATIIALAGLSSPLFAVLSGLLIGERITWQFLVSGVLLSIGIYTFYRSELTDSKTKSPQIN